MRDQPFSMKVDAPMWSARSGGVAACSAGVGVGVAPPIAFQRSTSFFTSSLRAPSSASSRSTVRNSSMISALSAVRSADAWAPSSRADNAAYRSRTSVATTSDMPRRLLRGSLEHDALVGGKEARHVEEDDETLAAPNDPSQVARRESAEQGRRRRHARRVEQADVQHAIHRHRDPLAIDGEHENAAIARNRRRGELKSLSQIDHRHHATLVVDHAVDPRRNVRHWRRRRIAEHALDREDVGGEQLVAEPKRDDLRYLRSDGGHNESGAVATRQVATIVSASSSVMSSFPRHTTPRTRPSFSGVGAGRTASNGVSNTSSTAS